MINMLVNIMVFAFAHTFGPKDVPRRRHGDVFIPFEDMNRASRGGQQNNEPPEEKLDYSPDDFGDWGDDF